VPGGFLFARPLDKDGKISAAKFKTGCGKGWVQSADSSTTKEMSPPAKL
jgi:hypothetical protein